MSIVASDGFDEVLPDDLPTGGRPFLRSWWNEEGAFVECRHGRFRLTGEWVYFVCGPSDKDHEPPLPDRLGATR